MSAKNPSIPAVVGKPFEKVLSDVLTPMKERLERIAGDRPGIDKIDSLPVGASQDDIIAKVNELLERLQA